MSLKGFGWLDEEEVKCEQWSFVPLSKLQQIIEEDTNERKIWNMIIV
jgi:hypothetical protein